jgi:hypothetical protein
VHLCQKVPFVLAAPGCARPENSDKKDALYGLDTQITISVNHYTAHFLKNISTIVKIF